MLTHAHTLSHTDTHSLTRKNTHMAMTMDANDRDCTYVYVYTVAVTGAVVTEQVTINTNISRLAPRGTHRRVLNETSPGLTRLHHCTRKCPHGCARRAAHLDLELIGLASFEVGAYSNLLLGRCLSRNATRASSNATV
jgi:hypothetical protein